MKKKKSTLSNLIISIIREDLGKIKKSSGRGYGTQQPYHIHSDKPMLGDTSQEVKKEEENLEKVKVSRAFKKF